MSLCCSKERKEAVLALQRTTDPIVGLELYVLRCALHMLAEGMMFEMGRLSLMDGSDCDDEDQHTGNYVHKEADSQRRSVPSIFFI